MPNIVHRVGIKAPISQVHAALTTIEGLSNWWTEEVSGHAQTGGNINFTFRAPSGEVKGSMDMQVLSVSPQKVHWKCVEGPTEWKVTDISFELSEVDGQTIVMFGHNNWKEIIEFYGHCSMKWATFLLSLRAYVETGKGAPSPMDLKIDNWN